MNKEQIHQELQAISEEDILPGSIHLWCGVQQSLAAKGLLQTFQGENKMRKSNRTNPALGWVVGLSATVILLGVFFFVTPQGKVLAQEIVSFFTRGESNQEMINQIEATLEPQPTELASTPLAVNPVLDEGCGTTLMPRCSLEEVQNDTPFKIQGFGTLPEGMAFSGAVTIPDGVFLEYTGDHGTLVLIETSTDAEQMGTWTVGKDANIQSTSVHQYPAEFVEGAWSGLVGMTDDELVWDESFPNRTLRWQTEVIDFTLMNSPFRGFDGPVGYEMDQLKILAEGLQADSDTSLSTLPVTGISLDEAEGKAGFIYKKSDYVPAGLSLYKTTYDSKHNAICQYYRGYNEDPEYPALVIVQSTWAMPSLADFQTVVYFGEEKGVFELEQTKVEIAGVAGDQADFYGTSIQVDAFCGGNPSIVGRALLWQQQNRTFAVLARQDYADGITYVTRLELQRIAESINGVDSVIDPSILDPERLQSLKDAEESTGLDILEPAVMLSTFQFDHIFAGKGLGPYAIISVYKNNSDISIGEVNRILVFQIPQSDQTLEQYSQGGGYSDTTIRGNPAIYRTSCTDSELYGSNCNQDIDWFEGDTQFIIEIHSTTQVPSETLIAIANSMQ